MAQRNRKVSRRNRSRNQRKNRSRNQKRNQRKNQQGGSCAARPFNRQMFGLSRRQQRGGMAPFNSPDLFLDQATMVQAQSADQLAFIQEAQVLAKQAGGRQSRRQRKRKQQRSQRRQSRRNQRGGEACFNAAFQPPPNYHQAFDQHAQDFASVSPKLPYNVGPQA